MAVTDTVYSESRCCLHLMACRMCGIFSVYGSSSTLHILTFAFIPVVLLALSFTGIFFLNMCMCLNLASVRGFKNCKGYINPVWVRSVACQRFLYNYNNSHNVVLSLKFYYCLS